METLWPFDNHNDSNLRVWINLPLSLISRVTFSKRSLIAICLAVSTLFCGLVMASTVPNLAAGADFDEQFEVVLTKAADYPPQHVHCQPRNDSVPSSLVDLPCWASATLNSTFSTMLDTQTALVLDLDESQDAALQALDLCDRIRAGPSATAQLHYRPDFISPSHRVLHCVLRL